MKRVAPAAERNKDAILAALRGLLPKRGLVLEIASGSGQHAAHFAAALPGLSWQPTDPGPESLRSIEAYRCELPNLPNLLAPVRLDVHDSDWAIAHADALLCINMIHIAPWSAVVALFAGARAIVPSQAPLIFYGPFARDGVLSPESNVAFDHRLRSENAAWGVRDLKDVEVVAEASGFSLALVVNMPANNLLVVFRKI